MNITNAIQFLRYIGTPLTKEEMLLLYKANNILYDRCELYRDFIASLTLLIFDTYLGDDIMVEESDIKKHFLWCYNKVIDNFKKEGIVFTKKDELTIYFYTYYYEYFYKVEEKMSDKLKFLSDTIFNYKKVKCRSDIDTMVEIYRMFEKSLK